MEAKLLLVQNKGVVYGEAELSNGGLSVIEPIRTIVLTRPVGCERSKFDLFSATPHQQILRSRAWL